jgi:molybdenum cofactor cytidylyltransferase
MRLAGVVLAAGRSSRFGSDKRQAEFDERHTLLTKSISLIEPCCDQVFVVTRPSDKECVQHLLGYWRNHPNVSPICASDADRGMGNSLAAAVTHLRQVEAQNGRPYSGLVLALADMPYIEPGTVRQVVAAHSIDNIVVPCYEYGSAKRWGHPVVFGRRWFELLMQLEGDRGGKSIIVGNPSAVEEVAVNDPGILRDVDQPEHLNPQS